MSTRKQGTRYPEELRRRAVRMVFDHQADYPSQWKAVRAIAEQLGVHKESLRVWVRSAETDAGTRRACRRRSVSGSSSSSARTVSCAHRLNPPILKAAASFFGAELDRQSKK